ncbi:MAG: 4Fe-4S dicluster domain-containing protein [Chloroflexi bacterium]|nr:MAG: 4Fe-4S dicluster domain-containing protein [Chloroflexota bacterium]
MNNGTLRGTSYLERGFIHPAPDSAELPVIPKDLCTRCGACHVICPTNVITFDDHEFPVIHSQNCIDCGLCLKVCPGIEFDLNKHHQKMFGIDYPMGRMEGVVRQAYVGYTKRPDIHHAAASGGVVTQLLIALVNTGIVDAAVVVGHNPDDPSLPMPAVARTEQEIIDAAQSKYVPVANLRVLRELRKTKEKFAFIGVPCQIHGLRKLEDLNKQLGRRAYLTLGLVCHGVMEKESVLDVLDLNGISIDSVRQVHQRDGHFPTQMRAHMKDKSIQNLHKFEFKDGMYNTLFRLYRTERCHLCPDYSAEMSDIIFADVWLRQPNGDYLYPRGVTLVACRTERGEQAVKTLVESGEVELEPVDFSLVTRAFKNKYHESRVYPFVEIAHRQKQGRLAPDFGVNVNSTLTDRIQAGLFRATFLFSKSPRLRKLILRFTLSPPGQLLTLAKMKYKKYSYALKTKLKRA